MRRHIGNTQQPAPYLSEAQQYKLNASIRQQEHTNTQKRSIHRHPSEVQSAACVDEEEEEGPALPSQSLRGLRAWHSIRGDGLPG